MKKFIFLVLFSVPVYAAEQADLSIPYQPNPESFSTVRVGKLILNWNAPQIVIVLNDTETGKQVAVFTYDGDTARNLMNQLNKMDLSSISLNKRIMNRLISDGFITGTVSGTPD